jgi:ribonuclease P protein component
MTIPLLHTLSRKERLRGDIRVDTLFTQGKAFILYPFRIVYIEDVKKTDVSAQVIFSVPKKRFKRAVKRNRLKRQMKEAYRLHKSELLSYLENKNTALHIAFTYVSNDELPYAQIEKKLIEAMQKLQHELG